jgi:phosphatidate cytidylyltransferase
MRPDFVGWVLMPLAVTWLNDTGAYAAGRAFGRHKLYPAVSPGKTWEGFFGGALASIGAAFLVRALFLGSLTTVDCLAIALPCSVLGPVGDLSESMLKRAYGVKDSGKLIPGHGGLLDRIDALLFNLPYIWLYATLALP